MSGQTERAAAAGGKQTGVGLEPWTGEGSGEKRERGGEWVDRRERRHSAWIRSGQRGPA
jgi:hypothetical protein